MIPPKTSQATAVTHPFLDFWLLGGASIAIWMILKVADLFRGTSAAVDQRFMQIGIAFSLLTLVCNHPHFMISYRFGYGRGKSAIFRNWFALIAVPIALITIFAASFYGFETHLSTDGIIGGANSVFEKLDIGFRLGAQPNLGLELMSFGVWLMYFTVGWHYAKQVFGAMMVHGRFEKYDFSVMQKRLIKGSVFSVGLLQFTYLNCGAIPAQAQTAQLPSLTPMGLPTWIYTFAQLATLGFFAAVLIGVFAKNYFAKKHLPSANLLIPWIALYVWWVPFFKIPEFTFLMVPFFHSLQYLPFAYRMEAGKTKRDNRLYINISLKVTALLAVGFFAFEGLPQFLDAAFDTSTNQTPWFFGTAFLVFINVHHFFIDAVVWKFNKRAEVAGALFTKAERIEPAVLPISQAAS